MTVLAVLAKADCPRKMNGQAAPSPGRVAALEGYVVAAVRELTI